MINNNPYNIPQRPLRPSSKIVSNSPTFNPNEEQNNLVKHNRYVKRNQSNMWEQRVSNQHHGKINIVNTRHIPKPMLNLHVSPTSHNYETSNPDRIIMQLTDKLAKVTNMLENHDRVIKSLVESKNYENQIQDSMQRDMNNNSFNIQFKANSQLQSESLLQGEQIRKINQQISILREQMNRSMQNIQIEKKDQEKKNISILVRQLMNENQKNNSLTKDETQNGEIIQNMRQMEQTINKNKQILSEQLTRTNINLSKIINQFEQYKQTSSFKSSVLKYSGTVTILKYMQSFRILSQNLGQKDIPVSQSIYYVDKNGYLLDSEKNYILNSQNRQVKLEQEHLLLLRKYQVII